MVTIPIICVYLVASLIVLGLAIYFWAASDLLRLAPLHQVLLNVVALFIGHMVFDFVFGMIAYLYKVGPFFWEW